VVSFLIDREWQSGCRGWMSSSPFLPDNGIPLSPVGLLRPPGAT
jgi:hypothetical protein